MDKVRFVTLAERKKGENLPYHQEYVPGTRFPREKVCCHLRTTLMDGKRYCVRCGEEVVSV